VSQEDDACAIIDTNIKESWNFKLLNEWRDNSVCIIHIFPKTIFYNFLRHSVLWLVCKHNGIFFQNSQANIEFLQTFFTSFRIKIKEPCMESVIWDWNYLVLTSSYQLVGHSCCLGLCLSCSIHHTETEVFWQGCCHSISCCLVFYSGTGTCQIDSRSVNRGTWSQWPSLWSKPATSARVIAEKNISLGHS
jgi:hypothetical protein